MGVKKVFVLALIFCGASPNCPNEPHCQQCAPSTLNRCLLCYRGYVNSLGACVTYIEDKIDKCAYYEAIKVKNSLKIFCRQCESGYFLNPRHGGCTKCDISDCRTCGQRNVCLACGEKHILDPYSQKCVAKNSVMDDNCLVVHFTRLRSFYKEECTLCQRGFALKSFYDRRCVETTVPDCQVADPKSRRKCRVCKQGYFISSDGNCVGDNDYERFNQFRKQSLCLARNFDGYSVEEGKN